MKKKCLFLLLFISAFALTGKSQAICPTGNILYVKADATGANNGSSWTDAYNSLQDALANTCVNISQIWVAKGTYYPDEGVGILPDDRSAAFKMKPGISIYGGFAGTEDPNYDLADRDFATNASILSGDLQQNDEDGLTVLSLKEATSRQDNSYNVIYNNQNGLEASDVLDGFTITGGNTNGSSYTNAGAGMSNTGSSPGVRHCKFTNCSALFGGALFIKDASSTITNCSFIRNNANSGAAIYYENGSPDFINCTIVNNRGIPSGGISSRTDVASTFTNCIIWTNGSAAQIITNGLIAPTATNCIVQGGYLNGTNISSSDPMFVNVGNLHLKASSPAVNAGLNGANTLPTDLDGNPRIIGGTIDLGAYESQPICPTGNILYVKADAGGANNGSSWTDAYNSLQDALANACVNVNQIWVAKGTYYPTTTIDRSISFVMKPGIAICGGFAGTEAPGFDLTLRDFAANPTILSGDIGTAGINTDNSYHVIFNNQNGLDENAKLDGFTITAGYANGGGDNNAGAGMFNAGSSPGISHCAFTQCRAATFGGALYLINASPTVVNCSFTNNTALYGSGINYDDGSPSFVNCSIVNNSGSFTSGGIHANTSTVSNITNCIAWGNSGTAQIFSGGTLPLTVTNSIVQGGYAGGTNILSADPLFVDAANGDLHLQPASPAINAGLNSANTLPSDLDGNARIVGGTIDIGAYESQVLCPSAGILYVNAAATGANNGSSWADAFTTLQDALVSACPDVSKIWVAKGTYHPDEGGGKMDNDRNAAFVMKNNLAIYGGFAGTEAPDFDLTQRNFAANPTILSGDLLNNDATGLIGEALKDNPTRSDNSYHVINNTGLSSSAVIDGFTITAGNGSVLNTDGAGMYNLASSPSVANCKFTNHYAGAIGAGIFNSGNSSPIITKCSFTNNHALAGGAIGNMNGASPKITNSIFNSNLATDGGGIFNNNAGNAIITNCSFTNNSGGAIKNISSGVQPSIPVLTNCILWNNTGGQIIEGTAGSVAIANYSIVQGGYAGSGNLDADPLFVDPSNGDLHLQPGSLAIDAGDDAANNTTTDLDGNTRIVGGAIDIGAYESQVIYPTDGIIYVKADAGGANNGSSWTDAYNSLQDALANACPGVSQIWVAKGTYYPTSGTDRSISFVMKPGIAMYGGFDGTEQANYNLAQRDFADNASILSGDIGTPGDAADNSYHVVFNNNNGLTTTNALLDGFTITGSNGAVVGGGMVNSASSPTVSNCLFTGNQASNAGAMMNDNCSPTITNCSFNNNESIAEGGAMFNNNNANPVITNCIFAKNKAGTGGGAIINSYNSQPKLINCSIGNNSAGINDRGGIYNYFSSPTIANCIIWGNNNGQIADQAPSQTTVSYSIVQGGFTGTGNLDADPLFVDPSNGDLRLQAGSPAINTGLNSANTLPTDLDGKARIVNGTIDRGAYETPAVCPPAGILYVNASAALGGDGTTWEHAFTKLQDALANTCPGQNGNKQIWVAKGTYYPDEGGGKLDNDRNASFIMKNNLAIYGGFAGTEAADFDLAQRDFVANPSILSGDIDKNTVLDDGNSYHVIFNNNNALDATAILDGFTITGGNGSNNGNVGGGMLNQNSSPTITNCSFNGNSAEYGGGINNYNSSPTITNCSFTGNSTTSGGGGIYNLSSSSPRITNCSFTGNSAFGGGGMYNDKSSPTVTNCSFYGNSAINGGGGMLNVVGSSPIITNCSFYGNNTSATGGGMLNQNSSPSITNSIIWGNSPNELVNNSGGTAIISYSIVPAGTNGEGNLHVDPLFVDAANGDLHLQLASPAIDAGDDAANNTTTDLDGNTRIVGGAIDMGAYESQVICPTDGIIYVKADAIGANNGSSWTNAYNSLQDALANKCPGVTQIWVAKGTYSPDKGVGIQPGDRNAAFAMKPGLAIYGGFVGIENPNYNLADRDFAANASILSGDLLQNDATGLTGRNLMADPTRRDNSYHVVYNNNNPGAPAKLDGFTITGGNANNFSGINSNGGGMYNNSSSPAIINCSFTNNSASSTGGGLYNNSSSPAITSCSFTNNYADFYGGGMANNASSPSITSCSFASNSAFYDGGALYNINLSRPSITGCSFAGNSAKRGGGMYNEASSPEVTNSSFAGNSAESAGGGGGIYNKSSSPTITKCSFTSNAIAGSGGGIYNSASSPAITECSFAGNSASRGAGIFNDGASTPAISICKFTDNSAGTGGGIYNLESRPAISNCSFVNNSAGSDGGGLFNLGSNSSITNCSFFNNHASNGGGISNVNSSPTVTNCSFAKNSANAGGGINNGISSPAISNSILWGNSGGQINAFSGTITSSIVEGGYSGTGILALDPLFVDITAGDLHLQACSPAINAGTADGAPDTDLDGNARPALDGYDMGAYEFTGTLPAASVLTCPVAAKVFACGLPGISTTTKLAYATSVTNITEATFVTAGGSISGTCGVSGISYQDATDAANSSNDKKVVNRTFTVSDIGGKTFTCTQVITVQDYSLDATASSKPVAVGTTATLSATVSPAEKGVPVDFYIDAEFKGTGYTDGLGIATLDVTGLVVDVYQVRATIGDCVEGNAIFSVYNPDGGFVTGAGWIISPPDALVASPLITGKANFGLNAKYQKGKDIVDGDTEFKFKAGNFNFKSLSNDAGSLVISGGKATYRGSGTVNDAGDYGFMVVAIDGAFNGSDPADKFRIKIWDRSHGNQLVYDNQIGKSEFVDDATVLGGGAIVIQTPKDKKPATILSAITLQPSAPHNDADLAIQVSNNPSAQGQQYRLQVISSDKTTPVSVRVLDASGRPVQSWKNQQAGAVLEAGSRWMKGMYIVEAMQNDKKVQVKLLKL